MSRSEILEQGRLGDARRPSTPERRICIATQNSATSLKSRNHDLRKTLGTPTSLWAADKDVGAPGFRLA
jgi:hypothetical protein